MFRGENHASKEWKVAASEPCTPLSLGFERLARPLTTGRIGLQQDPPPKAGLRYFL